MIHMKYIPTQDYSFLLDENHYVYDHVEEEDSLHIYIKSKEHGCKCPLCENMSTKLHATYRKNFRIPQFIASRLFYMQMFINMIVKTGIVNAKSLWKIFRLPKLLSLFRIYYKTSGYQFDTR